MLFAHLKRILKLDRLRLRGPCGARDEFHLAATVQNLRKLAKLIPAPSPAPATQPGTRPSTLPPRRPELHDHSGAKFFNGIGQLRTIPDKVIPTILRRKRPLVGCALSPHDAVMEHAAPEASSVSPASLSSFKTFRRTWRGWGRRFCVQLL